MDRKKLQYFIFLFATIVGFNSCMSDLPEDYELLAGEREKVSIQVGMPQNTQGNSSSFDKSSRVAFNDVDLSLTWDQGDQLALVAHDSKGNFLEVAIFNMTGGYGKPSTTFNGDIIPGATYDVYYPASAIDKTTGQVNMNYNGQVQTEDNNTSHLRNFILLKSVKPIPAEVLKLQTEDIVLQMQNAIIKFDMSNIKTIYDIWLEKIDVSLKSLTWTLKQGWRGPEKSMVLGLPPVTVNKFTAFMCFDPKDMNLESLSEETTVDIQLDGTATTKVFQIELPHNDSFSNVLTSAPSYLGNKLYTAKITFK